MANAPLDGKIVLVTGASSGIGAATAKAFVETGADVVATGRRGDRLSASEAQANGGMRTLAGDLTEPGFPARLADFAGEVDILVNCAAVVKHAPFLGSDPADWARVFDTNVLALLRLVQAVGRGMKQRNRGHIINVSSALARRVYPFTLVYSASKFAVRAIGDGLRLELQSSGIKVTEIAPGLTQTSIFRDIDDADVLRAYQERDFPWLNPEDVAGAIVFAAGTAPDACPNVISIDPLGQA